jgi:hypothetical protein
MKSLVIIITGLFSFFLFDTNLARRLRIHENSQQSFSREQSDKKEKLKKIQRKYKNPKYKKRKVYPQKRYKYYDVKPKDNRYSNQKTLRRMYRNS